MFLPNKKKLESIISTDKLCFIKLLNTRELSSASILIIFAEPLSNLFCRFEVFTKSISNKSIFVKLDNDDVGIVDGMTVDSEGFIWSAIWFSSKVMRFDPDGKLEREIYFPATQTSCPMFGGENLNELYVTTASSGTGENPIGSEPKNYDHKAYRGGDLFRVKLDIQGKPEYKTNL